MVSDRTYFAGIVLAHLLKGRSIFDINADFDGGNPISDRASFCFKVADKMVEASKENMLWCSPGKIIWFIWGNAVFKGKSISLNQTNITLEHDSDMTLTRPRQEIYQSKEEAEQYVKELSKNSEIT